MYCKKCGAQLPDGTRFCNSCGAATGVAPVAQEASQAQQSSAMPSQAPSASAYAAQAPAQKKPVALMAAIAAAVVVALVAGIAIGSGAFESKPASQSDSDESAAQADLDESTLKPGLYDIVVSYEGDSYDLFTAYVSDDMSISLMMDGSGYEPGVFSEAKGLVPGCKVYKGDIGTEDYKETALVQIPEGVEEGRFDGLWYVSVIGNDKYGVGVILNADGTGVAFLLDTGNAVEYLNSADEAYGLMDEQQFPISWHQTSPSSFEGTYQYYGDTL